MKKVSKIFFIITVLMQSFSVAMNADQEHTQDLLNYKIPTPIAKKSPEGINYWLIKDPQSALVSIVVSFKNGSLYDEPGKEGSAELFCALMNDDRVEYKAQDLSKFFKERGASFNVCNTKSYIFVKTVFPWSERESVKNIFAKYVANTNFSRLAFKVERNNLSAQDGVDRKNAWILAMESFRRKLYPDHIFSYDDHERCKNISAISLEEMRQYPLKNFNKNRIHVTCAGNIDEEKLEDFIDGLLGNLSDKNSQAELEIALPLKPSIPGVFHIEKEEEQSTIYFGFRCIPPSHPQWHAWVVLNHIIGIGTSSRLSQKMRLEQGLTYSINTSLAVINNNEAFLRGGFETKKEMTSQSIQSLFSVFRELKINEITAEEVEEAKDVLVEDLMIGLESLAGSAEVLEEYSVLGCGPNILEERKRAFQNVRLEDVKQLAHSLKPENFIVVCVGSVSPESFSEECTVPAESTVKEEREVPVNVEGSVAAT